MGFITNRVGAVLIFHTCGADAQHMWCGCLAHVVRMVCTNGADGMHHMCEGLTPLLYMEG